MNSKNLFKAYSTTELLVTIALIVILMALIFPAVQIYHSHANKVKCLANMRSYGVALLTYTADNGRLPLPGENGQGPNFQNTLRPNYIPAELFCPVTRKAPSGSSYPKNYKITYTGNLALARLYPTLVGIPAPSSRVVLAAEMLSGDGFQYGLHFNKAMWGAGNVRGEELKKNATIPNACHSSSGKRGMHCFMLDGSTILIAPSSGDWYDSPTYGDATNGGYFYDANQFTAMKNGTLTVQ